MALEVAHPDAWQRSLPSNGTLASTIKRVGKYFRDQATQQSHSALHLAPGNKYEHDQEVRIWSESRKNSEDHVRPSQKPPYLPPGISRPIRSSTSTMSVNSASGPGVFRDMVRHQYAAENILQSYDVLDVRPDSGAFWIVYIHGGYFRDPKVDATSFKPTISALEESAKFAHIKKSIAGYASINYRLAPHPAYPQSPDEPKYTLNSAHWPDQPADVIAALKHLQRTYPASKRYVLVGHSVGATLALLTALKCSDAGLSQPSAIGGVSGIYDFPAIHKTNPDYRPITENAIAKEYFADASPALHSAEQFSHKWTPENKRHVLLAHSGDDGLVGLDQPQEMLKVLSGDAFYSKYMELHGEHNEIWEKTELARVVGDVVAMVS